MTSMCDFVFVDYGDEIRTIKTTNNTRKGVFERNT